MIFKRRWLRYCSCNVRPILRNTLIPLDVRCFVPLCLSKNKRNKGHAYTKSEKIGRMKVLKINLSKDIEGRKQLVSLPEWNLVQVKMHNYCRGIHGTKSRENQWWNVYWNTSNTVLQGKPSGYSWNHQGQEEKGVPYFYYMIEVVVPIVEFRRGITGNEVLILPKVE